MPASRCRGAAPGPATSGPPAAADADVWLGDSMLEMPAWYALADVALLGGSFAPLGGQNLIEAAACGCPVVMGPHTFNFSDAAELALAAGAATRVADMAAGVAAAVELASAIVGADARRPLAPRPRFRQRASRRRRAHGCSHPRRPRRARHVAARPRTSDPLEPAAAPIVESPQRCAASPEKGLQRSPPLPLGGRGAKRGGSNPVEARSEAPLRPTSRSYLTSNASIPRMSDGTNRPEACRNRNVPSSKS